MISRTKGRRRHTHKPRRAPATGAEAAAAAERGVELVRFAYAASHDLNAPLRKITSFGDFLKARLKGKLDDIELDYLERMLNASSDAAKIVSDLLTSTRAAHETFPLETVDMNAVLAEVETELAPEIAAAGARIEAGQLPALKGHAIPLHFLLFNLLSNAVKFRRPGQPPLVRIDSRRNGEAVEISVTGEATSLSIANALINRSRDAFASALETDVIARLPQLSDRIALADQTLSYLPPEVAARLRAQLGADLGLSSLDTAGVIAVLRALPEQAAKDLRANMAPEAAKALDQALALAAQSVRREINRAVIQLMLASEEFDRLTVDRGMKPGDLGARMISESFKRLDERNRRGLRTQRAASIERLRTRIVEESHEAAAAAAGSVGRTLDALHAAPGWPAGLQVRLDATTRTELVNVYGEDALAAAVARLAVSLPAGAKTDIVIAYDASELGSRLDRGANGALRLTLGKPGKSADLFLDTAMTLTREYAKK